MRSSVSLRSLLALATAAVALSCRDSTGTERDGVVSVSIDPPEATVGVGGTVTLVATLRDGQGNTLRDRTVIWSVDNESIVTVSPAGVVTAMAPGSVRVAASAEGKSDVITVTVVPSAVASVVVTPPTASVRVGSTAQFQASVLDASGQPLTGRTVTWSTSNPLVVTVNQAGLATGVAVGAATITATSEGRSGTAAVTVSSVPAASVTVAPPTATIAQGQTAQLTSTVRDAAGNVLVDRVVTWTSSNNNVAIVSSAGLVAGLTPGSATITASVEGRSASSAVTVVPVPVARVAVTPSTVNVVSQRTTQLTATAFDANNNVLSGRTFTWTSSNPTIAPVNANGLVTGLVVGSVTITATSEGRQGTATVNVIPPPVATVTVAPPSGTVLVRRTLQLTATLRDEDGNVLTGRPITWTSSNPAFATVSNTGLVSGVAPGAVTISAVSEGRTGTATITVQPQPVATVTVTPNTAEVRPLQTVQLTATLRDVDGVILTDRPVVWSTSNSLIATVNASGLVLGIAPGNATITATSEGRSGTATVMVRP